MKSGVALLAIVLATGATLVGQKVQAPQAAFDVVSIKPNVSSTVGGGFRVNASGRVEWTNTTLRALLRMAYQRFGASGRTERPSRHGLCSGRDPGP